MTTVDRDIPPTETTLRCYANYLRARLVKEAAADGRARLTELLAETAGQIENWQPAPRGSMSDAARRRLRARQERSWTARLDRIADLSCPRCGLPVGRRQP